MKISTRGTMRSRTAKLLLVSGVATASGGCGSPASVGRTAVTDSLGIRISVTDLRDSVEIRSCVVGPEPSLRIGQRAGDPGQELYRVADARRLPDGRVVVLDRGAKQVRVFSGDGSLLSRLGRDGDGPGEFRDPVRLGLLAGDSIAVWDWRLRRIEVYGVGGGPARDVSLAESPVSPSDQFAILNGQFILGSRLARPTSGTELVDQGLVLLRYDRTGTLVDTVAVLPNGKAGWFTIATARRFGEPTFDSRALFASAGSTLYTTAGSQPSIDVIDSKVKTVAAIRWIPSDLAVTDQDKATFRESALRNLSPDAQAPLKQWLAAIPYVESFPATSALLVDRENLWIEEYQRPGADVTRWWSFTRQGEFRCRATLPPKLTAFGFGDGWVLGVRPDDFDVEYVEVWPLSQE